MRLINAKDIRDASGMVSVWHFLSAAQIANVRDRIPTDLTTALQSAFDSGEGLILPPGLYAHESPIYTPNTGAFVMRGFGRKTEFRPLTAMPFQIRKRDRADGATIDPVDIQGIYFDCDRLADLPFWIGISKKGVLQNIICDDFLVAGGKLGDDSGSQTASYYENHVAHIILDGGAEYSSDVGTMPTHGLIMTSNATDNDVKHVVAGYVSEAALEYWGGFNTLTKVHGYGSNNADTGPKYCIAANAAGNIVDVEIDNVTAAGIKVRANSVNIFLGSAYWAADNVPAEGGAVPVEVDAVDASNTSISNGCIIGTQARNNNPSEPFVRFLAGFRPSNYAVIGIGGTGFTPQAFDSDHGVRGSLLQRGRTGANVEHLLQVTANNLKAYRSIDVNGVTYHREGNDGTASIDLIGEHWNGTTFVENRRFRRASNKWTFNGQAVQKRRQRYPGQWFQPIPGAQVQTGSGAVGADSLRLVPFFLDEALSISNMGARITTAAAGGNFILGIYADDGAGKPVGAPLATTTVGSTANAAAVVVNFASALNLEPGSYWMAFLSDNGTALFQALSSSSGQIAHEIGSLTLGGVSTGSSTSLAGYSVTTPYSGGLPNATGLNLVAVTNSTTPAMYLRVAP